MSHGRAYSLRPVFWLLVFSISCSATYAETPSQAGVVQELTEILTTLESGYTKLETALSMLGGQQIELVNQLNSAEQALMRSEQDLTALKTSFTAYRAETERRSRRQWIAIAILSCAAFLGLVT